MQDLALGGAGSAISLPLPRSSSLAPGAAAGCQLPAPHPHRYRPICAVQRANCLGPEEEKKRVTLPGTGTDSAKIIWTDPRMCSEGGRGGRGRTGLDSPLLAGSRSAGPGEKSPCSAPSVPQFPPALGWRGAVPGGGWMREQGGGEVRGSSRADLSPEAAPPRWRRPPAHGARCCPCPGPTPALPLSRPRRRSGNVRRRSRTRGGSSRMTGGSCSISR